MYVCMCVCVKGAGPEIYIKLKRDEDMVLISNSVDFISLLIRTIALCLFNYIYIYNLKSASFYKSM